MQRIRIESKEIKIDLSVEALDNIAARKISASLPIESKAKIWGDEIWKNFC